MLFPLPEGPVSEAQAPVGTTNEMFLRTLKRPKLWLKFSTAITTLVFPLVAALAKDAPAPVKILAFGDSLTAGYKLAPNESYPAQLEALLRTKGYAVEVTNAGVSGDTSAQAVSRVSWNLSRTRYELVLLGLGANDGLRLQPLDRLEANLHKLIAEFRAHGAAIILLGMKLPLNLDAQYRRDFEALYPRIAKAEKVPLVPFQLEGIAAREALNLDDQVHPNAKGYAIMARNVAGPVEAQIKKLQIKKLLKEREKGLKRDAHASPSPAG